MRIIGINSNLEDNKTICRGGSISLIEDGIIKFAVAEDRISRNKYEGGYKNSLELIYDKFNYCTHDIDYYCISFYGNTIIPRKDILEYHIEDLGLKDCPEKLIVVPSHHYSHAIATYFLSPFNEALIMVADNEGSILYAEDSAKKGIFGAYCERNSYYLAKGNTITLIERDFVSPKTVAFGKAYNKFTEYIGFGDYHNAGKTMGLSSYGKIPQGLENVDIWGMDNEGKLFSNMQETYDSYDDIDFFLKTNNVELPPRNVKKSYELDEYKDLAFYIQSQLNKWATKKINSLVERFSIKNICLSGGVALNGVMNSNIKKELNVEVFVPPFPSDQGQSLGNAIYGFMSKSDLVNNPVLTKHNFGDFTYLGTDYSSEQILDMLSNLNIKDKYRLRIEDNLEKKVAILLSEGKIIGWFQGRSEYGARALGNRSILADPRSIEIRDKVNTLKKRELFRPLAPSVLKEYVEEYFENKPSLIEKHMLGVLHVKKFKKSEIEGVIHIDNTSRIQAVDKEITPIYYKVIEEFSNITGVHMVINTSFNIAGEPIVENPMEAFYSFEKMNLDVLVCGNIIVEKY